MNYVCNFSLFYVKECMPEIRKYFQIARNMTSMPRLSFESCEIQQGYFCFPISFHKTIVGK